jgi:hypothetical protein
MKREESIFEFEKKIGMVDCHYDNFPVMIPLIEKLLMLMRETNKINKRENEFFSLDFREPSFEEQGQFPMGSLILHLRWGEKRNTWIPVEDGYPENGETVQIRIYNHKIDKIVEINAIFKDYEDYRGWELMGDYGKDIIAKPTHWRFIS